MNCTVAATVTDQETLQEICQNDREFYGYDSDEEVSVPCAIASNSEDEYLSPNDDEEETDQAVRRHSLPEGTQASLASGEDGEIADIRHQIEQGCGCNDHCFQ